MTVHQILVLVEGQTEEQFIAKLMHPRFEKCGAYLQPIILQTSRSSIGEKRKGGISSYTKIKKEVQKLLGNSKVDLITTMIDFYGLPNDFPGKQSLQASMTALDKVNHLQHAFEEDIGDLRFKAFLTLHEFEALLFSDVGTMINLLQKNAYINRLSSLQGLGSPESINLDDPPAKRVRRAVPEYIKTLDGLRISEQIGLDKIRLNCPHFDKWVTSLENRFCR
ncbi:MAG: DUF4276 family protein [Fimbriimonadia bacterium]|nr:DUF4276 family protein [Fimbriimonadia bacterium]